MKLQEKQKELEQEIIANLRAIPKMPEGLLPHTVYVEEEGEEDEHHGIPVYTAYKPGRDQAGREPACSIIPTAGSVSPAVIFTKSISTGWLPSGNGIWNYASGRNSGNRTPSLS